MSLIFYIAIISTLRIVYRFWMHILCVHKIENWKYIRGRYYRLFLFVNFLLHVTFFFFFFFLFVAKFKLTTVKNFSLSLYIRWIYPNTYIESVSPKIIFRNWKFDFDKFLLTMKTEVKNLPFRFWCFEIKKIKFFIFLYKYWILSSSILTTFFMNDNFTLKNNVCSFF